MNVELDRRMLFWEMKEIDEKSNEGEKIDFTKVNYVMEKLLNGAECCIEMITNRNNLSNKDFYDKLNQFAYISCWDEVDCYKVLELAYDTKFLGETVISTTMHTNVQKKEGHGHDFSWWNEEIGIDLRIIYSKDFNIEYDHFYTVEEIKKLIDEKKVVIISIMERDLSLGEENYKKESYQIFNCAFDDYDMQYEFFNEGGKFYKYTLMYIKEKLTTEKLKELFSNHLKHTNSEVHDIIGTDGYGSDFGFSIASKYSKEFENRGYAKRLKRLNDYNYHK